jgi:hypothetical protein
MAGLGPATHDYSGRGRKDVGGLAKPGHATDVRLTHWETTQTPSAHRR